MFDTNLLDAATIFIAIGILHINLSYFYYIILNFVEFSVTN